MSRGDACAAAALAAVLVKSLGRPEEYQRALALAIGAQNAGVALPPKLCVLFELAGDRPGLAACYEIGRQHRFALMLAYGDGVPRDVPRALRYVGRDDMALREILQLDPRTAPKKIRYCDGHRENDSNGDMHDCAMDELVARDYTASASRAAALDKMVKDTRIDTLRNAFLVYRDVEADRRRLSFLGGSGGISGWCTETLKAALHETYDDILQQLAGLAPSQDASIDELNGTGRELALAEAEAGDRKFEQLLADLNGKDTATIHAALLVESTRRYRELEGVISLISKERLGAAAERGLLIYVRRMRIGALGSCPG